MIHDVLLFVGVGFLAVSVQSFAGFGGALAAMPLLLMFIPAQLAIPSFALMVLSIDIVLVIETRAHVDWRRVAALLAGAAIGAPLGALTLKNLPAHQVQLGVNVLVLLVAVLLWCKVRVPLRDNLPTRLGVGMTSGFLAGSISTGGPPIVIFGLAREWPKDAFRSTLIAYFCGVAAMTTTSFTALGMIGWRNVVYGGAAVAGALPAAWLGIKLKNLVSQAVFSRIVLGLITTLALVGLVRQVFW